MPFDFTALEQAFATGGCDAALASLAKQLEAEHHYHELFEALKMQVRHRLRLPLVTGESNPDELSESVRNELENGLIDACRRVGTLLLKQGNSGKVGCITVCRRKAKRGELAPRSDSR